MHHNIMYNNNTKRICQYKLIKYISTIALTSLQEDNTIKQISTIVDRSDLLKDDYRQGGSGCRSVQIRSAVADACYFL